MMPRSPSKELEKYIIWELDNIHIDENAPAWAIKEFKETFIDVSIVDDMEE